MKIVSGQKVGVQKLKYIYILFEHSNFSVYFLRIFRVVKSITFKLIFISGMVQQDDDR